MATLHIANTQFEFELAGQHVSSLCQGLRCQQIVRQLQYLPFLYMKPGDYVLLSEAPEEEYVHNALQVVLPGQAMPSIETVMAWGVSESLVEFLKSQSIETDLPSWDSVREVNSKRYSYEISPTLRGSKLLASEADYTVWIDKAAFPAVCKSEYGVAGRGHTILHEKCAPNQWMLKEWELGRVVVAEPWVERLLDFSSQWELGHDGSTTLVGITEMENSMNGAYRGTLCRKDAPPHFTEHEAIVRRLLRKVHAEGYFGPVGVDAMVYLDSGVPRLHPVVEINARRTMSRAALDHVRREGYKLPVALRFGRHSEGLLPQRGFKFNWKLCYLEQQ